MNEKQNDMIPTNDLKFKFCEPMLLNLNFDCKKGINKANPKYQQAYDLIQQMFDESNNDGSKNDVESELQTLIGDITTESESNDLPLSKFFGFAYSGDSISRRGCFNEEMDDYEDVVFDISLMQKPIQIPVLYEHDADSPCEIVGLATQFEFDSKVAVGGFIFNSRNGKEIVDISKQAKQVSSDFPWQLSFFISPKVIDRIPIGETINVNGRTFSGPISIFRNSELREVSFTPTAADSNTSAYLFNQKNQFNNKEFPKMDYKVLYENALKDIDSLKVENSKFKAESEVLKSHTEEVKNQLDTLNTQFKSIEEELKFSREQNVKQLFTSLNQEIDDTEFKFYTSMPTKEFEILSKRFSAIKPQEPKDDGFKATPKAINGLNTSFAVNKEETKPQADINPLAKYFGDK